MALLGFIASATEYLETHMGEEYKNLEELSDIDLDAIKKELADNLGNSFDRNNKNARKLLVAGKSAFQQYINQDGLIDEFDEIFNVDFRKANKEKDEKITNNLMRLLQGNNTVDDEIDEFAKTIANNREELINSKFSIKPAEAAGIDDIFGEIILNENGPVEETPKAPVLEEQLPEEIIEEQVEEENEEEVVEETVDDSVLVDENEIFEAFENEKQTNEENKMSFEEVSDEDIFEEIEIEPETIEEPIIKQEPIVEESIQEEVVEVVDDVEPTIDEPITTESNTEDDLFDSPLVVNPGLSAIEEEKRIEKESGPIVTSPINLEVDEYQKQVEKATDDYIARLLKDLNGSNISDKIEENRRKEKQENKIYDEIKEVYPYLTDGFVRRVYELKDSFEQEYEEGVKIILLQRLLFEDIDGLRKFVEVVMQHEYLVNVDEEKMIVDVFKEMVNSDGLILSEIFAIANQGRLLTGDFEGYRVIINEEQEGE